MTTPSSNYNTWLPEWLQVTQSSPTRIHVPQEACEVTTPLSLVAWKSLLAQHPHQDLVQYFTTGVSNGFRIGFRHSDSHFKRARKNMESAYAHKQVVDNYLQEELSLGRVAGPFAHSLVPHGQISRFGVIPKHHKPNSWRLIIDLSHPQGYSVNDGIPSSLCSIKYITIDDAINQILSLGKGTMMAKIDIKSAFRLLPVHPADRHLLMMNWNNSIYIDLCIPFGLRSAPKLFNVAADLLQWIAEHNGVTPLLHYLDDFLTLGPPDSEVCHHNLTTLKHLCHTLGVPLALEKVEGPATSLPFLGIILDSERMEVRLPADKLDRIKGLLTTWLDKKKATKREILSLVGLLQHAAKVVRCGRSFVSRMYATAARVQELEYFTRLNSDFRSDLWWWHTFLVEWNGISLLRYSSSPTKHDFCIQTDASGSWGCAAFFQGEWLQLPWNEAWTSVGIMAKELAPILLSIAVWGTRLAKKRALFQCDNMSVVEALKKGSSKDRVVMQLLRSLWFYVAHYDIDLTCVHIMGVANTTADYLSRNNMSSFFSLNPQASTLPTPLPPSLLQIVSVNSPDWTSPHFRKLFKATITKV